MEDNKEYLTTEDGTFYKDVDGKWYWEDGRRFILEKGGPRPPWLHGKGFENRENRNRTQGARKTITKIMEELNGEAKAELTKHKLVEIYKTLLVSSQGELKKIAKRDDTPLILVTIINNLLDDRTRAKTLTDYQTWIFGKAPEEIKVTTSTVVSEEEHDAILRVIGDKY